MTTNQPGQKPTLHSILGYKMKNSEIPVSPTHGLMPVLTPYIQLFQSPLFLGCSCGYHDATLNPSAHIPMYLIITKLGICRIPTGVTLIHLSVFGLSSCSSRIQLAGSSSSSLASLASFHSALFRLILPGPRGSRGLARGLVGVARMLLILSVRPWPRSPLRTLKASACLFA
ncbi:hypothetical protein GMOD_00006216 [Pyrenophora seminiperda CCB06]|uniref:Uncharacterized protein n=1 Tax=Pyrenophora seminiperda CCB06 TaxID=1302712 RepID=A0A3M7M4K4_9PLEO|nr:hypothetical protein GMOD_00006216 [Pyrenophora seminiperda CCB06]